MCACVCAYVYHSVTKKCHTLGTFDTMQILSSFLNEGQQGETDLIGAYVCAVCRIQAERYSKDFNCTQTFLPHVTHDSSANCTPMVKEIE